MLVKLTPEGGPRITGQCHQMSHEGGRGLSSVTWHKKVFAKLLTLLSMQSGNTMYPEFVSAKFWYFSQHFICQLMQKRVRCPWQGYEKLQFRFTFFFLMDPYGSVKPCSFFAEISIGKSVNHLTRLQLWNLLTLKSRFNVRDDIF